MRSTSTQRFLFDLSSSNLSTSALIWENVIDPFSCNKHRCTAVQLTCIHLHELEIELNQSLFWRSLQYLLMMICHSLFYTMKFPRHQVDTFFLACRWILCIFVRSGIITMKVATLLKNAVAFKGNKDWPCVRKLETTETWSILTAKTTKDFDTTWPLLWEVPESCDICPIVHIVCPADVYQGTSPSPEGGKRAEAEKFE